MHAEPSETSPESSPLQVRPRSGGGEDLIPEDLRRRWAAMGNAEVDVVEFYGFREESGKYICFSNFYAIEEFVFEVPEEYFAFEAAPDARRVPCGYSEKAVMLCKAAAMGDQSSYQAHLIQLAAIIACKRGQHYQLRCRHHCLQERQSIGEGYCSPAIGCAARGGQKYGKVTYQKFRSDAAIREVLLATSDAVIAEAVGTDKIWGIGLAMGEKHVRTPGQWSGTNILGWALMEARAVLRQEGAPVATPDEAGPA